MFPLHSVFENCRIDCVYAGRPDNASANGDTLDMSGYEGVAFLVGWEAGEVITCSIKAQQGSASNMSDAADLAGSSVTVSPTASARGSGLLDIQHPTKRYVRCVVTAGDFTTPRGVAVMAIRYGAKRSLSAQTGMVGAELHISPAEGTA